MLKRLYFKIRSLFILTFERVRSAHVLFSRGVRRLSFAAVDFGLVAAAVKRRRSFNAAETDGDVVIPCLPLCIFILFFIM